MKINLLKPAGFYTAKFEKAEALRIAKMVVEVTDSEEIDLLTAIERAIHGADCNAGNGDCSFDERTVGNFKVFANLYPEAYVEIWKNVTLK